MKYYRWIALCSPIFVIILDRYTKAWALVHALTHADLTSWCATVLFLNTGIAWSIGAESSSLSTMATFILVTVATGLCLAGFIFAWWHNKSYSIPLGLLVGGAVSNLYDRMVYGAVIDFILLHYADFAWPVFNIADLCICIGGISCWFCFIRQCP